MIFNVWGGELGKIEVVDDEAYSLGKRVQPLMSSFCVALACCGCIKRRKPDHRHYEANARAFRALLKAFRTRTCSSLLFHFSSVTVNQNVTFFWTIRITRSGRNTMSRIWVVPLSALLSACGGGSGSSNSAPVLENPGALTVLEGSQAVATLNATDVDGDTLTYSISTGADGGLFSISSAGELSFSQAPDFESRGDSDSDNEYELTVEVSDGALSASQSLSVSVTDAFEGRVVDAPISGASVFVDLNGNGEQDADEPAGVTDSNGFFNVAQFVTSDGVAAKVISIGGTDTKTGKALPDLALISDLPTDLTKPANVTPLTTIVASVESPEEKAQVLTAMGISSSPEELLTTDNWAAAEDGDETAKQTQRVNQQVALLLQTAATVIDDDDETTDVAVALAQTVATQISEVAIADSQIDLTSASTLEAVLVTCVAEVAPTVIVDTAVITAVADSVAAVNSVVADPNLDPVSNVALDVVQSAQEELQESVASVVAGDVSVDDFESVTDTSTLFSAVVIASDAPDTDADGVADAIDTDDDGDGVQDAADAFPLDASESIDTDADGIGNKADTDDDGDGVLDTADAFPLDANETLDTDADGIGNKADTDDDGDSVLDTADAFPLDANESVDTDSDGIGNKSDTDDDGDGVLDTADAFPLDATETLDTDADGIGNNKDTDDDNDGILDSKDTFPLVVNTQTQGDAGLEGFAIPEQVKVLETK